MLGVEVAVPVWTLKIRALRVGAIVTACLASMLAVVMLGCLMLLRNNCSCKRN